MGEYATQIMIIAIGIVVIFFGLLLADPIGGAVEDAIANLVDVPDNPNIDHGPARSIVGLIPLFYILLISSVGISISSVGIYGIYKRIQGYL